MESRFVVIDGIDGAGGETQTRLLTEFLKRNGIEFVKIESPKYSTGVGKAIRDFLDGKIELPPEARFLLFATDVMMDKPTIEKARREGRFIVADRYITSTIAYQTASELKLEKLIKVVKLLGFPEADLIILIDIKPETSMRRKMKEVGSLDRHETDLEYLRRVREAYFEEARLNVLGRWVVVDGEKSIGEVHEETVEKVLNLLKV